MTRGDIWLAHVGRKRRPVLVLTRPEVIDVRQLITVAEITTTVRGLAVEIPLDEAAGLERASVVNCDGIHTVARSILLSRIGGVDADTMARVCRAVGYALGC